MNDRPVFRVSISCINSVQSSLRESVFSDVLNVQNVRAKLSSCRFITSILSSSLCQLVLPQFLIASVDVTLIPNIIIVFNHSICLTDHEASSNVGGG